MKRGLIKAEEEEQLREKANKRDQWKGQQKGPMEFVLQN